MNPGTAPPTIRIEGPAPGPHLLITGGVHGDEFEPMAAIRRLARCLPRDQLCGVVTLIPVVNLAAYRRGSRAADDDLDLARTCPGDPAGSVTEQTAHVLSAAIRAADYYIDLHTAGTTMRLLPMCGYVLHPDAAVLDCQRRMARAFNLPVVWGTNARLDGRSLSVARDAGVPAIYAEYGGAASCDPQGVTAYVEGSLNVAAALDMLPTRAFTTAVRYVVEDDRDDSGHLQVKYPAPCEGFFDPCVALGQHVALGDPLGTVSDLLGEQPTTVAAEESGLVLLLRTFPHVAAGDTLAVILPIDAPGTVRFDREPRTGDDDLPRQPN